MASPSATNAATTLAQTRSALIQSRGRCKALPAQIMPSSHDAGTIAGMLYLASPPGTRLIAKNGTAVPQHNDRANRWLSSDANFENRANGNRTTHGRK